MSNLFIKHFFNGGWVSGLPQTDVAPQIDVSGLSGVMAIPFLTRADGVVYEKDGAPRKAPGASLLNSSALESGADVMGIYDAWFLGAIGTPVQRRVVNVGTKIKRDLANGTFADLFTGMTAGAVPSYAMLADLLVMVNDSGIDVPKSWDGTTAQNLGGSPPTVSFVGEHKGHMFGAGNIALPSRLYYVTAGNLGGSSWSNIDISPNDGDRIVGFISWRDELWVFKGPYHGSIHRISGSSSADFARKTFVTGIGGVSHNSIAAYSSDVCFLWSDGLVHSLTATASYGDANEAALGRDIQSWVDETVNFAALDTAHLCVSRAGMVLVALPIEGSLVPNVVIGMDFRFSPVRWFRWPDFDMVVSMGSVVDTANNNKKTIFAGCTDGYVRKLEQPSRSIDGTTLIEYRVKTPVMTYGMSNMMKVPNHGSIGILPRNNGTIEFAWSNDNNTEQTIDVMQQGSDVLGPADEDEFTLDTSTLGGSRFVDVFFEMVQGGEFRGIEVELRNAENLEDVEIHSVGLDLTLPGAPSYENAP